MRRVLMIGWLWAVLCAGVAAQGPGIVFDGEAYSQQLRTTPREGDQLIEFVRAGESFEHWTRLVGLRLKHLPELDNDPKLFALALVQAVKQVNPEALTQMAVNEKANEALVDFVSWPADGEYLEFNIYRCVKSRDGKAVVLLNFAYRFIDQSDSGVEHFKKLRSTWIKQAVAFDMNIAHTALERVE